MPSLTLQSKKRKWLIPFFISLVLFILNLVYLGSLHDLYGVNESKGIIFLLSLVMGAVTVYILLRLLPYSSYLELHAKGFAWRSMFYGEKYLWREVGFFTVNRFGFVTFDVSRHGQGKSVFLGRKKALPDSYEKTPEQLAELMDRWRKKYA